MALPMPLPLPVIKTVFPLAVLERVLLESMAGYTSWWLVEIHDGQSEAGIVALVRSVHFLLVHWWKGCCFIDGTLIDGEATAITEFVDDIRPATSRQSTRFFDLLDGLWNGVFPPKLLILTLKPELTGG